MPHRVRCMPSPYRMHAIALSYACHRAIVCMPSRYRMHAIALSYVLGSLGLARLARFAEAHRRRRASTRAWCRGCSRSPCRTWGRAGSGCPVQPRCSHGEWGRLSLSAPRGREARRRGGRRLWRGVRAAAAAAAAAAAVAAAAAAAVAAVAAAAAPCAACTWAAPGRAPRGLPRMPAPR